MSKGKLLVPYSCPPKYPVPTPCLPQLRKSPHYPPVAEAKILGVILDLPYLHKIAPQTPTITLTSHLDACQHFSLGPLLLLWAPTVHSPHGN